MGVLLSRLAIALFLLAGLSAAAAAQSQGGMNKDSDGQFTGIAIITDDLDWYDLFQRPEAPQFSGKSHFGAGEEGSLAIIFSNAEPSNGVAEIRCDITAFDPAGSRQVATDDVCYRGPYRGPNVLHPTLIDLRFSMGPDEPVGTAGFLVTLRDVHSRREVNLRVSFTQGPQP